jgi:hypothetical protein
MIIDEHALPDAFIPQQLGQRLLNAGQDLKHRRTAPCFLRQTPAFGAHTLKNWK